MQPLSATDAIRPAWEHTRRLLLGRGSLRPLFKIAAVAFFAEVGGGFNLNLGRSGNAAHHLPPALAAVLAAFLLGFAILAAVLALVLFYVGSRLQFVLFHIVLRAETAIGPIWRRYGAATWRWIGLKLLFLLAACLCLAPLLLPAAFVLFRQFSRLGGQVNPRAVGPFLATMVGVFGTMFFIFLAVGLVFLLLRDFALPSMALEGTSLREAVRRVVALVRREPGPVLLFVLLRFALGILGSLVCYLVLLLGAMVAAVPLGAAAAALWLTLRHAAVGGHVLMIAGWAILGLLFALLVPANVILLFGCVFVFLQSYAILFLAGRYPLLGSQLVDPLAASAVLPAGQPPLTPWPAGGYVPPHSPGF